MNSRSTLATTLSAIACGLTFLFSNSPSVAEELKILYRNDTVLTATLPDATIDWVTVSENGSLIERKVKLAEIKSLTLSRGKSSELIAEVRQNITRLGDADYLVREKAELALASRGGQFKNLLEQMEDSPSMEVRHRAGRLLSGFSKSAYPPLSLDELILANGRTLQGEARDFSVDGAYRGTPISLNRQTVSQLLQKKSDGKDLSQLVSSDREPVKTEVFHKHTAFFNPNQSEFRFETDGTGEPFRNRAKIDAAFAKDGLLLHNEQTGYVGVSVFSFKYDGLPVGGRSVCLYGQGRSPKLFKGFMEIRFCVPGKPTLPAGVKEAGLFIARVDHSRDFVMEAYNAEGNVLATVEATDRQCVFVGVKSNELITRLRIFSNPWLRKLSRKVDDDFAIDTLRMSKPIAVKSVSGASSLRPHVELTNGDRFSTGAVNTNNEGDLLVYVSGVSKRSVKFIIKQDELASIHLNADSAADKTKWKAMLEDGSVVNVSPGETMTSDLLGDKFSKDDLVALWRGSAPARYPIDGDWKKDQTLVVFPTCRIQSDPFKLGDRGVSWTVQNKLQQELMLGFEDPGAKENQEDPTPSETSFAYANTTAVQLPTFWNRQPRLSNPGSDTGVVELADGQRFIFGEGKPFQFEALKNREIRLTWMEQNPVNISLKKIRTIIFPK